VAGVARHGALNSRMGERVQALPIDPILPELVRAVRERGAVVLEAPPGAGKTTRVPGALLDGLGGTGEILVLEPRRLAARMAAKRVADERGERVGETVGYQVRFEDVSSARTRIRFVTEGVLTRRLVSDRDLRGVDVVVLDEFHERHLHGDVALALVHRLRRTRRPDLRVIVMSATLGVVPVAEYLGAVTLRSEGRMFDVEVEHASAPDDRPLALQVASAVRASLRASPDGHVLVFLPGASEIRKAREACAAIATEHDALLLPLHGDLSPAEQDRAVGPSTQRKVILATNVAESSVTIDGVVAVVDSGLARVAQQAPWSGLPTLTVAKVSRASAIQRAGRAGRTRAGRCVRLYTQGDFQTRPAQDAPEIARMDLAQTYLELGVAQALDLAWLDPPPAPALQAARTLLERLGALDTGGHVTPMGERLARLPLHPRQGRVLIEAEARGAGDDGAVVAALLGERDLRLDSRARFAGASRGRDAATEPSDVLALLALYREAEGSRFSESILRTLDLDAGKTRAVSRAAEKLRSRRGNDRTMTVDQIDAALLRAILAGYPDRVARRGKGRALALAFGGTAELSEASVVRDAPWLVGVDAELGRGKVQVRLASAIEPEWLIDLAPELIVEEDGVSWDATAERVEERSRMTWGGLVLSESGGKASAEEVTRALGKAATDAGWRTFDPEGAVARWLARARFAAEHVTELTAPSDDDVGRALEAMCAGRRSFRELREASLLTEVEGLWPPAAASRLRALAPERIQLPGGRALRIEYEAGKAPWAESRLQDFYGMADTPKLADGRVALVLHLLAPNGRAVQVSTDLSGFWSRHYATVRKELARKYPRHSWPDDPLHATPPAPRAPHGGRRR
jgi:ATP-dependent helicase HrpB